jgi:hypothetical protein
MGSTPYRYCILQVDCTDSGSQTERMKSNTRELRITITYINVGDLRITITYFNVGANKTSNFLRLNGNGGNGVALTFSATCCQMLR